MMTTQELIERDIGKMVIRINTLIAQLNQTLEENEDLKERLARLTTEVHSNGA
jgi:archaellum component FlaC